ncbi:exodeoxyribonuclease V subunit beta [Marinomonas agarivorans]|nr:exodeoxyribonuclease V subunit beta [Marinomonas agarivorans]
MTVNALDAMTFPLFGKRLIEASAGTGKTYTIANLYLRLLLSAQSEYDFARPLTVDQILVVTFTEAATAELKARIRLRIRQARKALLQANDQTALNHLAKQDGFLAELIQSLDEKQKNAGVEYLLYAEKQMDEAAIFTIHGFCQRMLSQNAFESRMLFQQSIETDDQSPLALAVKDVWRVNVYPMTAAEAALIKPIWSGPDALQQELRVLQNQPDIKIQSSSKIVSNEIAPSEIACEEGERFDLSATLVATQKTLNHIKKAWLAGATEILTAMNASGLDGRFWVAKKQEQVAQTILEWAQSDTFSLPKELEKFNSDLHKTKLKKNGELPQHDFFVQVAKLYQEYPTVEKIKPALLATFWQQVQTRLVQWQQQSQKLTFTDLLTSLDAALTLSETYSLAKRIRQLYPIALIDEFQDTDPVQFRIFNRIYGAANKDSQHLGLIMIGDPKQAIYAFRGADIYTYLKAREQADAIYALGTNYRSSAAMIQSVNALFNGHDKPFKVTGIPFSPVQDRAKNGQFYRHDAVEPALQLLCDESVFQDEAVVSPAQYQQQMAEISGQHIAQLLVDGAKGKAHLAENKDAKRAVYSGDIAVLVSGYQQAQLMKRSLAKRGVASVYLSDRGSVFASNEARDLLLILQAILSKGQEIPLRSALATDLLGWQLSELDLLNQDDLVYEQWVEKFQHYFQLWDQRGILPMLRAFMQDLALPQTLLAGGTLTESVDSNSVAERRMQGERRLTDLLHLGEKLQQKAMELESKEGLLRYFALAIQQPDGNSDEQKIRLETDDDLVRIITIHKSKGLEYPIVYLPFACMPFRNRDKYALYHGQNNQLFYAPTPAEEQSEKHTQELYAGEMRLAYVALTRAREVCYIGCAQVGKPATKSKAAELQVHLSGVGALLSRGKPQELGVFENNIRQWLEEYPTPLMALQIIHQDDEVCVLDNALEHELAATQPLKAATFHGTIERDWWVGSYSSLVVKATGLFAQEGSKENPKESITNGITEQANQLKSHTSAVESSEPGKDEFSRVSLTDITEPAANTLAEMSPDHQTLLNAFTFPKGAKAGTFLHDLLEGKWLNKPANKATFADLIKTQHQTLLDDYATQQNYSGWLTPLSNWLKDIVTTEIMAGFCLQDLSAQQCHKEMEFFLPVAGFSAKQLDQLARQHDPLLTRMSAQTPMIEEQHLKGMLKGFIDLLFEHEGRYYVMDYKSNHLGMSLSDYQQTDMEIAMVEHRYDLQYQLYTLALHRFLSQRLPNYDYDKHVGGVCYLFLRGLSAEPKNYNSNDNCRERAGVFTTRLTKAHVEALDQLMQGKYTEEKTAMKGETVSEGAQYDLF